MAFLEVENRRSRRAQRKYRKRQDRKQKVRGRSSIGIGHNLGPPLSTLNDDQVLTFNQWVRLNSISPRNGGASFRAVSVQRSCS
jgi:hypothetical protein